MVDQVQPTGFSALVGWFKNALGNYETRRVQCADDGSQIVTTTGASGASKDYYYATGGSAAAVDISIPGGARIAVVTLEGTGVCKSCLNAPNTATRDAWFAQVGGLADQVRYRRLTPTSDIDDRTFLVDVDSTITKLSFLPDATISGIQVRSI